MRWTLNKVKGIKITLDDIINSNAADATKKDWVIPHKATILAYNTGTLVELPAGELYLVPVGDWFRSPYYGKLIPQVSAFNQLQDYGLTAIKDKIIRYEEPKPVVAEPKLEKPSGQEIRSKNNVGIKKIDKAVASNIKSKEKDQNRP